MPNAPVESNDATTNVPSASVFRRLIVLSCAILNVASTMTSDTISDALCIASACNAVELYALYYFKGYDE